jgi:tryptophan 2-monooxygenase
MAITKGWNLPAGARKAADSASWFASYPNPADLNFNYRKLLDNTATTGIAKNTNPNFRVAVVGAGIAGITAARELMRCGFKNIDIYEASDRYGGRHWTETIAPLTTTNMQYTVQEGGAMRMPFFLAEGSDDPKDGVSILAYYLNEFDIKTEGFPNPGSDYANTGIYYNDGYASDQSEPTMLMWRAGEKVPPTVELKAVWAKWHDFIVRITDKVREICPTAGWPSFWQALVRNYWKKTFRDVVLEEPKLYEDSDPANWGGVGMTEHEAALFYIIGAGDGSWTPRTTGISETCRAAMGFGAA